MSLRFVVLALVLSSAVLATPSIHDVLGEIRALKAQIANLDDNNSDDAANEVALSVAAQRKSAAREILRDIEHVKSDLATGDDEASSEVSLAVRSKATPRPQVESDGERVLHDIARVRGDLAARDQAKDEVALAVNSKATARARVESEGERVLRDIAQVKRDMHQAALQTRGIGSVVQTTVDRMHCRNLKLAETVYGKDSPEYVEALKDVIDAQKKMKPNFKLIDMLEKILNFLTLQKKSPESARLTKEGEDLINPCDSTNN